MTTMVKGLIISILSTFFICFSSFAKAQEMYFGDGEGRMTGVKDCTVKTDAEYVVLSWRSSKIFAAPYVVVVKSEYETLDSVVTDVPAYMVDAKLLSDGVVSVYSSSSNRRSYVHVMYVGSRVNVVAVLLIIIGILVVLCIWLMRRKARRIVRVKSVKEDEPVARKTQKYESATVLFSDIQGFTRIAEHMNPEQLVDELDKYFIYFDELVDRYDVEKIKTIGDAYMCAGGVPDVDSANPVEVALVGLGMIDYVKNRQNSASGFWNMRVGIHTGPLVSASLGNKKKVFDIWGDSVNTASRMESSGVPGEVNVSGDTYAKISDFFECEYRGKMPVKYKGEIDMYFVKRLKPEYAESGSVCKPNKLLCMRIQQMKVDDMLTTMVLRLNGGMQHELAERLESLWVDCEMLCRMEVLDARDVMFCKLLMMSLFLSGECPKEYHYEKSGLATKMKRIRFDDEEIEQFMRVLTKMEQGKRPTSHVEEVVMDVLNMVYSKKDAYRQLKQSLDCALRNGRKSSVHDWYRSQMHVMNGFAYYTNSAREVAEVPISDQKEILEQIIRQK